MKTFIKQKLIGGIIFGFGIIISILGAGIIYSSWSGYSDLPTTSVGSGLTMTMWNNLIGAANKSIKQDSEIITVDNTNSRVGIGTNVPSAKLDINGTLKIKYNADYSNTINSVTSTSFNNGVDVIGAGILGQYSTYLITISADNLGTGTPYIIESSFIFRTAYTNAVGTKSWTSVPFSTHQDNGGNLQISSINQAGNISNGLSIKYTGGLVNNWVIKIAAIKLF